MNFAAGASFVPSVARVLATSFIKVWLVISLVIGASKALLNFYLFIINVCTFWVACFSTPWTKSKLRFFSSIFIIAIINFFVAHAFRVFEFSASGVLGDFIIRLPSKLLAEIFKVGCGHHTAVSWAAQNGTHSVQHSFKQARQQIALFQLAFTSSRWTSFLVTRKYMFPYSPVQMFLASYKLLQLRAWSTCHLNHNISTCNLIYLFHNTYPDPNFRMRDQVAGQHMLLPGIAELVLELIKILHGNLLSVSREYSRCLSPVEV